MSVIEFSGEAYESWQAAVERMAGYTVKVSVPTDRPPLALDEDYTISGPAYEAEDGFAILVRRYDHDLGGPVGEELTVVPNRIFVY